MTDELVLLFGGRTYPSEKLVLSSTEIDFAMKTDTFCPKCLSVANCKMAHGGWQCFFDERASDYYSRPSFRWGHCRLFLEEQQKRQERSTFTPRFLQRNFDTFVVTDENRAAFEAVKEYADSLTQITIQGLMLIGPTGTGKTHLAAAVLKAARDRKMSYSIVGVPMLLDEIRRGYESKEHGDHAQRVMVKRVLVLDDLGAERESSWVAERLYMLINYRYEQMLPTIVTSNHTVKELEGKFGSHGRRIMDRLAEMCEIVPMAGRSWRRRRTG